MYSFINGIRSVDKLIDLHLIHGDKESLHFVRRECALGPSRYFHEFERRTISKQEFCMSEYQRRIVCGHRVNVMFEDNLSNVTFGQQGLCLLRFDFNRKSTTV